MDSVASAALVILGCLIGIALLLLFPDETEEVKRQNRVDKLIDEAKADMSAVVEKDNPWT